MNTWDGDEDKYITNYVSDAIGTIKPYKIKNGSTLSIGYKCSTIELKVDQHFNWFQKLMWKLCFGVKVKDFSGEVW